MDFEPNSNLSTIFAKKYEQIRILGEGNYGKAILVKSLTDKVTKKNFYIYKLIILYYIIVFSSNKIDRFIQIKFGTKKRRSFRR